VIVDSSVIVSILMRQPGHEAGLAALGDAPFAGIGSPTLTETGIVLVARKGTIGKTMLHRFVQETELAILPFTADHWPVAVDAFAQFGKGRHPAGLNFGDCLTYAVARIAGRPLLCLGEDFPRTDLEIVPLA
jgi:ribonuclease VapC